MYLTFLSMVLISSPTIFINLFLRELHLRQAPWILESEPPTTLGLWSPWVSAGLALLGVVIVRYHDRWMEVLQAFVNAFSLYLLRWRPDNSVRRPLNVLDAYRSVHHWRNAIRCMSTSSIPTLSLHIRQLVTAFLGMVLSKARSCLSSSLGVIALYFRTESRALRLYLLFPLYSIKICLVNEWRDFITWFRDPYCVEDSLPLVAPIDLGTLVPSAKPDGASTDGPEANVQETPSGKQQG